MLSSSDAYAPAEMKQRVVAAAQARAAVSLDRVFVLAVLAGAFIALGSIFSLVAGTDTAGLGWGLQRVLVGGAFSIGLMLVVVAGAELFTGDNLMAMAWAEGVLPPGRMLRVWAVVLGGNIAGAVSVAVLWRLASPDAPVVDTLHALAGAKASLGWSAVFFRAVLCNVLVCLAVWATFSCRTTGEKLLAVLGPVTAFVAAGFEHCVANFFFFAAALPEGLDAVGVARNLVAAVAGNVVGGVGLVALVYAWVYRK